MEVALLMVASVILVTNQIILQFVAKRVKQNMSGKLNMIISLLTPVTVSSLLDQFLLKTLIMKCRNRC